MSFSCTIRAGKKDLTEYPDGVIHCQLLNLGPNGSEATFAPFRVSDFRDVVQCCKYVDRFSAAAKDCFKELQEMAKANLAALQEKPHCETCKCILPMRVPNGWSIEALNRLLAIDASTITYIQGGY